MTTLDGRESQRLLFQGLSKLNDEERLYSLIAYQTAPTLSGVKPSNLVSFTRKSEVGNETLDLWERYGQDVCRRLKLQFKSLCVCQTHEVILFYREGLLKASLQSSGSQLILHEYGYSGEGSLEFHLNRLKDRYRNGCPHEIGVFLGIPPEDVRGFIENRGENCLQCRYWKVYHNHGESERLFSAFDRAKNRMAFHLSKRYGWVPQPTAQ